jgi:hypothetical protein
MSEEQSEQVKSNNDNNISIGSAIIILAAVIPWVMGIAVSSGFLNILTCVIFPPYAWVMYAKWLIA